MKFTIVTSVYNSAPLLDRTLQSVLRQSYHEIEHLIIDGASSDTSLQIARDYEIQSKALAPNHIVHITSEPDNGLYYAMNKGIRQATGDYLIFLNAGDTFPSNDTLELVSGCVGEGEPMPGVLYGETDIVDLDGRFIRHRRLRIPEHLSWRSFLRGMLVCHQSFYARTSLAKTVLYDTSYRYSADVDWCIRIMKSAKHQGLSLRNTHMILTNYLDGGMSIQNHKASLKERFKVMCRHYGFLTTSVMHVWFIVRSIFKK